MGIVSTEHLAVARADKLLYYSPYYFLRNLAAELQQELFGVGVATRWEQGENAEVVRTGSSTAVHWLLDSLPWDSAYFATPTYRLFTGLFDSQATPLELVRAATELRERLAARHRSFHAFGVVPAEDVQVLQALTGAGWQLVETRLTYYHNQLSSLDFPQHLVRAATPADATLLGQIAASARNPYDRLHADVTVDDAAADAYAARYAENTVTTKLAAAVLVPDEPGLSVDSFLAISDLESDAAALKTRMSRVLLTAVGPANRGWHVKLVAETLRRAQALNHESVLMTTQATNHAVFRTCEKLGFRLGATSHVLVCRGL
jgi:dTDP-4-amino-4,6-dideoxy-D-galactose acyltransferase